MTEPMLLEQMALPTIPADEQEFVSRYLNRLVRALQCSIYPEQMTAMAMHELLLRASDGDLCMRQRILDYIARANVRDFN